MLEFIILDLFVVKILVSVQAQSPAVKRRIEPRREATYLIIIYSPSIETTQTLCAQTN